MQSLHNCVLLACFDSQLSNFHRPSFHRWLLTAVSLDGFSHELAASLDNRCDLGAVRISQILVLSYGTSADLHTFVDETRPFRSFFDELLSMADGLLHKVQKPHDKNVCDRAWMNHKI